MNNLDKFLEILEREQPFNSALMHHERIEPMKPHYGEPLGGFQPEIIQGLARIGIKKLYAHQSEAVQFVRNGRNVVTVTPTASGKSLFFLIPVIESFLRQPDGRALFLFPLKALAQDQAKKLDDLLTAAGIMDKVTYGIYDGDTPGEMRSALRKSPPNILITNPDMLHLALMSYHENWERLFRNLKFIILDELHIYRGVFGSHILHLLHRIVRLCRHYGSSPQFLAASATIAGAGELAETLTGEPFEIVAKSGAPSSRRSFLFFNPSESYLTFSLKLFLTAIKLNLKPIIFTKARRTTELLHMWLRDAEPRLARYISSYRAGFLAEERREIESALRDGLLKGVISTSALELGIDIGGLDVCILVGYPGTISATWQRAGRVGRGQSPAAICLVAGMDQLDQYFMRFPRDFFDRCVEKAIIDPGNPDIAKPHILCAAQELPISGANPLWNRQHTEPLIPKLVQEGLLLEGAAGGQWFSAKRRPQRDLDIRAAGEQFTIELCGSHQTLGAISGRSVFAECHPGAIYLHRSELYLVTDLNLNAKKITVQQFNAGYYTQPLFEKDTEIINEIESRPIPDGKVSLVKLKVTERLVGYQKRKFASQELISQHDLDFPPTSYHTIGLALAIPPIAATVAAKGSLHFRGGIHGAEHGLLALAPLYALCDRNDLGGYSQSMHPQIGGPAIFLYDGHPGGIGLSVRLYEVFGELAEKTLNLIQTCSCESGCPSCIQSPKCGHGNQPLDKQAAVITLEFLTGKRPNSSVNHAVIDDKKSPPIEIIAKKVMSTDERPPSPPAVPQGWPEDKRAVVFDIETQRGAEEVGGWGNVRAMGLAWAAAYTIPDGRWLDFTERDVKNLIETLAAADLVVGFNHIHFDYEVLKGYSGLDFSRLPNYDLLVEVKRAVNRRLSLNAVASATLGVVKSADGLQSLRWWREGRIEKVAAYCRKDVEVTRDLFNYAFEKGYLLFESRGIGLVRATLPRHPLDVMRGGREMP